MPKYEIKVWVDSEVDPSFELECDEYLILSGGVLQIMIYIGEDHLSKEFSFNKWSIYSAKEIGFDDVVDQEQLKEKKRREKEEKEWEKRLGIKS